ncbi:aminopeptidase N [Psychrobium sp. MM17-31]|uniref:aminopeptidase N n=1 Tax=Psychrobium sp. MM17-31 TaxID=2917758 RepID=UPI001EF716D6|nr:aminopeptidase N [Psychrobium sp. MM17-31]MCG7529793.1 aminopeptidase N [Psychrobium sp. MM17-31]
MSQDTTQYLKDYQTPDFTIDTIDLVFELNETATVVTATSQVKRLRDGAALALDGEDLELLSVAINQHALEAGQFEISAGKLIIPDAPEEFELTVVTQINPSENTKLEGLYLAGDAFCTQCEAEGFRRITYYLDRPDVMAIYTTKVIADRDKYPYLLSNGNKVDSGELDGNRHFATWNDPHRKPAYLFALVAGDFDLLEGEYVTKSGRKVALEFFVDKGNKEKAVYALGALQRSMKWDEERFGLEYDLDIYMVVAVDFFNMGAMENKGLNVFNSKYVLADRESATDKDFHGIESVIGHEYFHNWTGNRITCRDWFQLSLKEGLTVFRDQEFSSDLGSRAVNRIDAVKIIRSHQFAEDASPMAHPIRPQAVMEMNNFYTVTVYNKGAEVIRMIHTLLGEENFQAGMREYVKQFDGMAVTCDEFVNAMATGSGIDLTQFKYWYEQKGTPVVSASQRYDASSQTLSLDFKQVFTGLDDEHALQIPVNVELITPDGQVLEGDNKAQTLCLTSKAQTFEFNDVPQGTVAVLLGDFSAPIKLEREMAAEDLVHTLSYSQNDFSRWDSAQQLLTQIILENSKQQTMSLPANVIDAVNIVLNDKTTDPALVALAVELPADMALFELETPIDVDGLLAAKQFVKREIAKQCGDALLARYQSTAQSLAESSVAESAQGSGLRALKLVLTSYLCAGDDSAKLKVVNEYVETQFNNANEMTESINALAVACQHQLPCFDGLSNTFAERWKYNGLVMDKWFMTIGQWPSDDALEQLALAKQQPSFSWHNPNRVRSLIGAFAQANAKQFHRIDGSGYEYLTDQLIKLNDINPQIAARLITPLLSWHKFDKTRASLMKQQVERLANLPALSKDLTEKVTLSLTQ